MHNSSKETRDRMRELMIPIDQQIMMCDDRKEILMLACAMLQRVTEMLDSQLGEKDRKQMFESLT
jgi:hypothetical protein